jgi:HupE / UreJ protein
MGERDPSRPVRQDAGSRCFALHAFVLFLAIWVHDPALAHKASDSYLTLEVQRDAIEGEWDIALRDLDIAIGLDDNQDGAITWGEVRAKHDAIAAYALSRLQLGPSTSRCAATVREQLFDNHSDGAYAVLRFTAKCPSSPRVLEVSYRLLFDVDPQHRGLLNLSAGGERRAGILSVDAPVQRFTLAALSPVEQFVDYVKEGVFHIWTGFDHMLFLLSLLLPAVLVRTMTCRNVTLRATQPGPHETGSYRPVKPTPAWAPAPRFSAAFWDVFKVVTSFTVAHSITLSLAALGVISLPSRFVESAIAASVVLAALNNVRPVVNAGRWIIAFCFGLIHGFGFASVLTELGLSQSSLLQALLAFNVGVELGQLLLVAAFLPIAYASRQTRFYSRTILVGGSVGVAAIALLWLLERALNVTLLPALGT